jgi:hypothetical protein
VIRAGGNVLERELALRLCTGTTSVVGRLERGRVIRDLRAILPNQDEDVIATLISGVQSWDAYAVLFGYPRCVHILSIKKSILKQLGSVSTPGGGRGLQTRCGIRQTGSRWVRFPSTPAPFSRQIAISDGSVQTALSCSFLPPSQNTARMRAEVFITEVGIGNVQSSISAAPWQIKLITTINDRAPKVRE